MKIQEGLKALYDTADEMGKLRFGAFTPGFSVHEKLLEIIDKHIPKDVSVAQDRLFISLSNYQVFMHRDTCFLPYKYFIVSSTLLFSVKEKPNRFEISKSRLFNPVFGCKLFYTLLFNGSGARCISCY